MAAKACSPIIYPTETSRIAKPLKRSAEVVSGRTPGTCRDCEGCGEPFLPGAYKQRIGRARFCSTSCASRATARRVFAPFWEGEQNGNFKNWASRNKRAYVNRYRAMFPLKAAANDAVSAAVRAGRLVRPAACESCGMASVEPLHGHHDDYTQPLSVRWLCRPCHRAVHIRPTEAA